MDTDMKRNVLWNLQNGNIRKALEASEHFGGLPDTIDAMLVLIARGLGISAWTKKDLVD